MKKDIRLQPRWFAYLRTVFGGYFWIPCPICGEYFGGFETSQEGLQISYIEGKCVCMNCGKEAKKRNKENNYFIPSEK